MSASNNVSLAFDRGFGPQVAGNSFDLTLFFEQSILSILPSTLLLLAFPIRLTQLYRESTKARNGSLLTIKLAFIVAYSAIQLALLILWASPSQIRAQSSVPAAVISLLDAVVLLVLSFLEHTRSVRPSSLLSIYLLLSTILDVAQARSLWIQISDKPIASLFATSLALKVILLILESVEKRGLLTPSSSNAAHESTSGIYSRSVFWWLNSLLWRGHRLVLDADQLPKIEDKLSSSDLAKRLTYQWTRVYRTKKHCLVWALANTFKWDLLSGVAPRLLTIGFTFAQPFLINTVINHVTNPATSESHSSISAGLIAATALVYIGIAVSTAFYMHKTYQVITMLRGALVPLIFDKTLTIPATSDAAGVTLMSTDIDGITSGFSSIHDLWASPIELIIGIYLLERQVGKACIFVVFPAVICSLILPRVAKNMGPTRMIWNAAVQKRVNAVSSVLGQMQGIKLSGLSDFCAQLVQDLRITELELSKQFRLLIVFVNMIANLSDQLTPVVVIAAAIFWTKSDSGELSPATAFTSLSIIALVSNPLTTIIGSYPSFMTSVGCADRIEKFLLSTRRLDYLASECNHARSSQIQDSDLGDSERIELKCVRPKIQTGPFKDTNLFSFQKVSLNYTTTSAAVLKDFSTVINTAALTIIAGPVGCGKSTLLKSLLGEVMVSQGSISMNSRNVLGSIGYCEQKAWLTNGTVKENIIGHSPFDFQYLQTVTDACCLEEDFVRFSAGIDSTIGSGGVALSGGQKQRVSLARALYARKPLLILDDVFSGLDPATADRIFQRLFDKKQGILRQGTTTTILATHTGRFLPHADKVIMLDAAGSITHDGPPPSLKTQPDVERIVTENTIADTASEQPPSRVPGKSTPNTPISNTALDLKRQTGDMKVYAYYYRSVGMIYSLIWLVLAALYISSGKLPQIWLSRWTEEGTSLRPAMNFGVYAMFAIVCVLTAGLSVWFFLLRVIPRSATRLHWLLLTKTMNAKSSFFTRTDTGITLNLFSQDMSLIDQALPMAAFTVTFDVYNIITEIALIAFGTTYVAALIPVCILALYVLQKFYLRTSRQLRFLDLELKSPLYTSFTETLAGLLTIRAFGWSDAVRQLNIQHLDVSQKPYYLLFCLQRWLNLVLGLMVAGLAIATVAFAVEFNSRTSGAVIGLAMINIIGFNQSLAMLINSWTTLETSLGAVSRVRDFVLNTPTEDCESGGGVAALHEWPNRGAIEFEDVSICHNLDASPVVKGFSLSIQAGERIGIRGRTGSGKSSLISAILRCVDLGHGRIMLDGVDLATLPPCTIRSSLITLPQEVVILPGTVRANFALPHIQDKDLLEALTKVKLADTIRDNGGLDADLSMLNLSQGQQQLFAVARALLYESCVVIMDEATSNLDAETEDMVMKALELKCKGCTVLAVSHRPEALTWMDRVIVMDCGQIVECDARDAS